MKYYDIIFFDGASIEASANTTPGFMEVSDAGDFIRLTNISGDTFTPETIPPGSYSTTGFEPCAKPAWGL